MSFESRKMTLRLRFPLASLSILLLLGGCGGGADSQGEIAEPEPIVLRWPPVEGADRYQLRVWARERLLFEESVPDTVLTLPESLRRTVAAFDSVEVVVRGMRAGERMDAEALRWTRASGG